jgi:hypothetical protein
VDGLGGLAVLADTMSAATRAAGNLVQFTRDIVRDLICDLVARAGTRSTAGSRSKALSKPIPRPFRASGAVLSVPTTATRIRTATINGERHDAIDHQS